jgi:hypothetical protein
MWPLPRELLWAVIIALALGLISTWPTHQQLISYSENINSQQQQGSPAQKEKADKPQNEHRDEIASDIFGIRPGEWLLGLVTLMLWIATARLVKGTEATAERQLRAYVYIRKTNYAEPTTDAPWTIKFRIENFGQTPAHNVRVISIAKTVAWNKGIPEVPTPNRVQTIGSMAPTGDFFDFEVIPEGDGNVDEIKNGSRAIFLVGTIIYDTVFEMKPRVTNFSYYVGGDVKFDDSDEMSASSEGNNAT